MEDHIVKDCFQWQANCQISKHAGWIQKALYRPMPQPGAIMRVGNTIHVVTPEGVKIANPTDYILLTEGNELYVCTEKEFKEEYE